ncbi:hypothetical protein KAR91_22070 [Candidatus Pacearchaeota archaeon]|nr:hypothetical protein [Candidatus Pacearchaeota archaeon]
MPERRFPVTPVGLAYLCDECKQGLAIPGQIPVGGYKTETILHVCQNCGHRYHFTKRYPSIDWRFPSLEEVSGEKAKTNQTSDDQSGKSDKIKLCERPAEKSQDDTSTGDSES